MRILVFPANMQESLLFMQSTRVSDGEYVLASSLPPQELREFFADQALLRDVVQLPYVTSAGFDQNFLTLVQDREIDAVFTPHPVVWKKLEAIRQNYKGYLLLGGDPFREVQSTYLEAKTQSALISWEEPSGSCQDSLPTYLRTAVVKAVAFIPGQSSVQKLAVIASIAWSAPVGDRIEIGSLWGRSSFVIALTSTKGCPTICVDPWSNEHVKQQGSDALLSWVESSLDMDLAFDMFLSHMAPFAPHRCNYIRDTSSVAVDKYRSSSFIRSEIYGNTAIYGKISILNIDGNHDYEKVKADLLLWTPYLTNKGWIFIDDYRWAFGDGPKKAADEWLYLNFKKVHTAYVVYGCLFIRLI